MVAAYSAFVTKSMCGHRYSLYLCAQLSLCIHIGVVLCCLTLCCFCVVPSTRTASLGISPAVLTISVLSPLRCCLSVSSVLVLISHCKGTTIFHIHKIFNELFSYLYSFLTFIYICNTFLHLIIYTYIIYKGQKKHGILNHMKIGTHEYKTKGVKSITKI